MDEFNWLEPLDRRIEQIKRETEDLQRRNRIRQQSAEVAAYLLSEGPHPECIDGIQSIQEKEALLALHRLYTQNDKGLRQLAMEDHRTKLLKAVEEAIDVAPPTSEGQARAAIIAVADWFDELLETMGVLPAAIPSLLRWQANQHHYLGDDTETE